MKSEIKIPSIKTQKAKIEISKIGSDEQSSNSVDFDDYDKIPDSWKPFKNGYIPPSAEEIRKTFGDFSSSEIANMLGLSDGRIIRRWKSGENEIPYAAWRLFLIITERIYVS